MSVEGLGRTPIDGVSDILGTRQGPRRSVLTPARTKALGLTKYLAHKHSRHDWAALATVLPDLWAGENGWDTEKATAMVKAATPNVSTAPFKQDEEQ